MAKKERKVNLRHRGRLYQIPIYLGKLLRGFVYMSDWKMLPMAAVIAALVCMVVRKSFFISMDGTLKGSFAFCCVAIWNGCFNSIQVICRERPIVKREHRSGMHISSYIIAHMIYQALLCAGQTAVTIFVSAKCGVKFPTEGFITGIYVVDIGITLFLISYASDMLSLLISAFSHSTTAAMTVMPFILIFQLVFSGGFWALPSWAENITKFTISNYGLKCINAQANYNELPMATAWNALAKMEDNDVAGSFTIGELLDVATNEDGLLKDVRAYTIDPDKMIIGDTADAAPVETEVVENAETVSPEAADTATEEITAQEPQEIEPAVVDAAAEETAVQEAQEIEPSAAEAAAEETPAQEIQEIEPAAVEAAAAEGSSKITVGEILDAVASTKLAQNYRDVVVPFKFKIRDVIDTFGREELKETIQRKTAESMMDPAYDRTEENIKKYWCILGGFALLYALIAMCLLEFIDKDKR